MKRLEETYQGVAEYIKDTAIPVHRDSLAELAPGECNDPNCWIGHCAEGVAQGGRVSRENAAKGIHQAFEERFGETPREAYIRETAGTPHQIRSYGRDR